MFSFEAEQFMSFPEPRKRPSDELCIIGWEGGEKAAWRLLLPPLSRA